MTLKFLDEQGDLYRVKVMKSGCSPYYEIVEAHIWIDELNKWEEIPKDDAPEDWLEYAQESEFSKEKMKRSALYYVETLALAKRRMGNNDEQRT